MYEDAQEIFNYLPSRRDTPENDYIDYLWGAFSVLEKSDRLWEQNYQGFTILDDSLKEARPFLMMPFHLLFMMAVQYKVLRIAKAHKQASDLFFSGVGGRSKTQLLLEQRSVFDIALINERTIPEVFQLIGLDYAVIKKIKDLVDERNDNLAHAKGGIELDFEGKIEGYLAILKEIQPKMVYLNDIVAEKWLLEMVAGQDGEDYIEMHMAEEYLCPADMNQGKLAHLDDRINGLI